MVICCFCCYLEDSEPSTAQKSVCMKCKAHTQENEIKGAKWYATKHYGKIFSIKVKRTHKHWQMKT